MEAFIAANPTLPKPAMDQIKLVCRGENEAFDNIFLDAVQRMITLCENKTPHVDQVINACNIKRIVELEASACHNLFRFREGHPTVALIPSMPAANQVDLTMLPKCLMDTVLALTGLKLEDGSVPTVHFQDFEHTLTDRIVQKILDLDAYLLLAFDYAQ